MTTYTIYADTSDFEVDSYNILYATARAGSNLFATTGGTSLMAGQKFLSALGGVYYIEQSFLGFDTSAVPAGTDSNISISLNVTAFGTSGKTLQIRESAWTAGNTSSFIAGASLGALTSFGSLSVTATGYNQFTSGLTAVPRSALYKVLVCGADQTNNVAPAANPFVGEDVTFDAAETSGTTTDPKLVFDSVTASSAIATNGTFGFTPTGAIKGNAALASSATFAFTPTGAIKGSGRVLSAATFAFTPAAAIKATGAMVTAASFAFTPTALVKGIGAFASAGTFSFVPTAALKGTGTLSTAASFSFGPAATLGGTAALSTTATFAFAPTASLKGLGSVSSASTFSFTPAALIGNATTIATAGSFAFTPAASVAGYGAIDTDASFAFVMTALIAQASTTGAVASSGSFAFAPSALVYSPTSVQIVNTIAPMGGPMGGFVVEGGEIIPVPVPPAAMQPVPVYQTSQIV